MHVYLQITNKCGMRCAHCCHDSGIRGRHMDTKIALSAIDWISEQMANDDIRHMTIGGGEPTLHPDFWTIMGRAITHCHYDDSATSVGIVTNGEVTDSALKLASLAKRGVIVAALSQDLYHSQIDDKVVRAFKSGLRAGANDLRSTRNTSHNLGKAGRAASNGIYNTNDKMCCGIHIKPSGVMKVCSCKHSPVIGDFKTGVFDYSLFRDLRHSDCSCYVTHNKWMKSGGDCD